MTRTDTALSKDDLRRAILDDPALVLEDGAVMRALIEADTHPSARNVVDLRGVLLERLEARLGRLEDVHREVIAAAYENVAGTNQVHRACLALLDAPDFAALVTTLAHDLPAILAVDEVRLGLEVSGSAPGAAIGPDAATRHAVIALPRNGVQTYIAGPRGPAARIVTLRAVPGGAASGLYGARCEAIRSEALLRLDLGAERAFGLLAFGATDPDRFSPDQGTDLLKFLTGVVERILPRHLA